MEENIVILDDGTDQSQDDPMQGVPQPLHEEPSNVVIVIDNEAAGPAPDQHVQNNSQSSNSINNRSGDSQTIDVNAAGTPRRKKRRRSNQSEKSTPKAAPPNWEDEDNGSTCPICFDSWEIDGLHRIVSLNCGHLFGKSCVKRWLRERPNCPTCKKNVKTSEMRHIFAKIITAVDKSEENRLRKDIAAEKKKNVELSNEICFLNNKLALVNEELTKTRRYLNSSTVTIHGGSESRIYKMALEKNVEVSTSPGCRAMVYGMRTQSLVISQVSTLSLFPGYGVRFMSMNGFVLNNFMHTSTKTIRDLSLDNEEELLVSASIDKSAKLFSIPNRCPISVFTPSDKPIWSVAFDRSRTKYLYLGSQHGSTYVYDIRSPQNYVEEYTVMNDMSPVVGICSIPFDEDLPFGGFVVCKLKSLWFYEYTASQTVVATKLIIDGPFVSVSYDEFTKHIFISTRPSEHKTARYIIASIVKIEQNVILKIKSTIHGSKTQKVMCRGTQMKVKDDIIVAAYLEDTKILTTWNSHNCNKMQSLPIEDTILDTCPLYINQKVYLGALSENRCRIYQVNAQ